MVSFLRRRKVKEMLGFYFLIFSIKGRGSDSAVHQKLFNQQDSSMDTTEWVPSLWVETFDELQYDDNELDYGEDWTLNFNYSQTDKVTLEERKRGWKVYSHCAYGNFQCETCRKTWPSARVMVLFRYRLLRGRGTVIMRPFGQTCRHCSKGKYDLPGFSKKEVNHALLRLISKIRKNCYNEEEEHDSSPCSAKVRTKPHEKTLCEACALGICCQDD